MKKNVYQLIGLACRAGQVSSGSMAAKTSLLRKRAHLLIMSKDISPHTRDNLVASCSKNNIPWILLGDKYQLGANVGKAYRVALTINDRNMAQNILKTVKELEGSDTNNTGVIKWQK